jgi:hypothetical protein
VPARNEPQASRGAPESSIDAIELREAKEMAERVGFEPDTTV